MPCTFPHCTCIIECSHGGAVPKRDPSKPLFDRAHLNELAQRHEIAVTFDKSAPDFHLSNRDMEAIAFALRFTAQRL